jgi:hypothetical protein
MTVSRSANSSLSLWPAWVGCGDARPLPRPSLCDAARLLGGLRFRGAGVLDRLHFYGAARFFDDLCFCGAARILGDFCFCGTAGVLSGTAWLRRYGEQFTGARDIVVARGAGEQAGRPLPYR